MFLNKKFYAICIVLILGFLLLWPGIISCMERNKASSVLSATWSRDLERVKSCIVENCFWVNWICDGCYVGKNGLCCICHKKIPGKTALDLALKSYLQYKDRGDTEGKKNAGDYLAIAKILIAHGGRCNKWYGRKIKYHPIEYGCKFMVVFVNTSVAYRVSSEELIEKIKREEL